MDLNELLHAHQVEVMKASGSGDDAGQKNHFAKVTLYAEKIRELRESLQGLEPRPLVGSGETVIYGTYVDDPSPSRKIASPGTSESDEVSRDPAEMPLPPGMTSKALSQYYVGAYTYSDLSLALAEHTRQKLAPNTVPLS